MQVRINRRPVAELLPRIERRLVRARGPAAVAGEVLDGPAALQAASRGALTMIAVVVGVAVMTNLAALWGISARQPQHMKAAVPFTLVFIAAVTVALALMYRQQMRRTRERLEAVLGRMPPPGAPVRVDAQGLDVGGRTVAWNRISIEAVDITRTSSDEGGDSFSIDTLVMRDDRGREIVLDVAALRQGRKLVDFVWRSLRPRP